MASGKLSPRQKMINMMYLVLMALLALNVSREILKTFHLMEVSFNKSKEDTESQIGVLILSLEEKVKNKPKMQPYLDKAKEAKKVADEFVAYIDDLKKQIETFADGRNEDELEHTNNPYEAELTAPDQIEDHANLFMVKEQGKVGKELAQKINDTRMALVGQVKELYGDAAAQKLDASSALRAEMTEKEKKDYPGPNGWAAKYLEHSPAGGVMAILTKFQTDARATQLAVTEMLNQGEKTALVIKELVPIVKTNTPAVLVGQEYSAEIFLAAITDQSGQNEFKLTENAGGKLDIEGDKGVFKLTPQSSGEFSFGGVITVKTEEGDKNYEFKNTFQAFTGDASIAATEMYMLYIGVDNPISIAVPGVSPDKLSAGLTGVSGSISKVGAGKYMCKVNNPGRAKITVTAELSDGTKKSFQSDEFRVRNLPKPEAKWGTLPNDGLPKPKAAVAAQSKIFASMGESFAFESVKFNVTQYEFIFAPRRGEPYVQRVSGSSIPQNIKSRILSAQPGDRIIVNKLEATGPGGKKPLNPVLIELR